MKKINSTILKTLANLTIPGLGFAINGNIKLTLLAQLGLFSLVFLFVFSRAIFAPAGMKVLLILIIATHLVCGCISAYLDLFNPQKNSLRNKFLSLATIIIALAMCAILIIYKSTILGLNIFHIPSNSMNPTIYAGDFILVNTWHQKHSALQPNDIVVFYNKSKTNIYVKRIKNIVRRANESKEKYFVVGDNLDKSADSRHFGPIEENQVIAKAEMILISTIRHSRPRLRLVKI